MDDENCHVVYSDTPESELKRVVKVKEHDTLFWAGALIEKISSESESMKDCYRKADEDELACYECEEDFRTCECNSCDNEYTADQVTEDGKIWDDVAGAKQSKMFGFFNHCQWSQEEVEEVIFSNKVVLVQFGEKGFTDTGVAMILIDNDALKKRDFNECKFYWSQT